MAPGRGTAGQGEEQGPLERDLEHLAMEYPDLEVRRKGDAATTTGPITQAMPDGTAEQIQVRIEFSAAYPKHAPRAYDEAGRWQPDDDRHIEPNGHFCLFLREVDEPNMGDPEGIGIFMDELRIFLRQQLILDSQLLHNPDAKFPGTEWPHGAAAYVLFCHRVLLDQPEELRELMWSFHGNQGDPCFCDSGLSYAECHRPVKLRLIKAAKRGRIQGLTYERLVEVAKVIESNL